MPPLWLSCLQGLEVNSAWAWSADGFFTMGVVKYWHRLHRDGGSILGNTQGQVGQGSEQPDLVKDVLPCYRGVGLDAF